MVLCDPCETPAAPLAQTSLRQPEAGLWRLVTRLMESVKKDPPCR